MTAEPRLVILRPLGLGDLLTAVPALRALARAFPDHRRLLAAPQVLEPIAMLTDSVHAVVHTAPLLPLPGGLQQPDVAVDLHGRGPASQRILLAAHPGRLISFANPEVPETSGFPSWSQDEHEVVRWCRMLTEHGIVGDPHQLHIRVPDGPVMPDVAHATILHPGAGSAARRWPVDRWAVVARREQGRGRPVIVTGSGSERRLAQEIVELAGIPPSRNLAGRTSLAQLAGLIARSGRLVSGDTGVAHLATAYGTPSVTLFGPVAPDHWGPPDDRGRHVALWAGRLGDPHGSTPDPGLLRIEIREVLAALDELPTGSRSLAAKASQIGRTAAKASTG